MARTADFDFFLNQRNPYKRPNIGGGIWDHSATPGQSTIYPGWADVLSGEQWEKDQIANQNTQGQPAAPTSLAGPADTSNPFTTLRNVKNPGIEAATSAVLGQITSLNGPQPDTVVRSTRSQNMADRLSDEFHNFDTDRDGNRATLADFTNNFMAAAPQAQQQTDQEINSVGQFYDGTVRRELDDISGARRIATAGALTPAIQAVLRNRNMGALLGGNDSYLDTQVLNRAGRLARDAAVDNAEQLKGNYMYSREGQNRLLGARSRLLDSDLMRELVPTQAGQQINANDLSRLYGLGAAENANTNYRVTNPQTELAMKLGLLGDTSRLDLQNTFYGLKKPYEPNTQGYLPMGGGGGSYNFSPAADAIISASRGGGYQPRIAGGGAGGFIPQPSFDMGAGSPASQARIPGSTVQVGGATYIVGPGGELQAVGPDGLTDAQRFYEGAGGWGGGQTMPVGGGVSVDTPYNQGFDYPGNMDFFSGAV